MKTRIRNIILAGIFAALTAVLAQIALPIPPVPVTLTLLAVFLSSAVLGSKYGAMSQIVYILMGAVGVPVFSGFNGGLQIFVSPKGGYILSYPVMAYIIGIIIEKRQNPGILLLFGAMLIGIAVCYSMGASWMAFVLGLNFKKAVAAGVTPFIVFDLVKAGAAAFLGYEIKKSLLKARLI